ncbi:hypothetical protein Tco_0236294 [Tanacetum coccineum]
MGLWLSPKDTGFDLTAFSDSDHAGCLDSRKSTSGGIQFLGGDKLVSWSSKKQDCTSMSLAEASNVSLSACCAQVLINIGIPHALLKGSYRNLNSCNIVILALSWKPCQGDSLNLPDHRFIRTVLQPHDCEVGIINPNAHTQAFKVNHSNVKIGAAMAVKKKWFMVWVTMAGKKKVKEFDIVGHDGLGHGGC